MKSVLLCLILVMSNPIQANSLESGFLPWLRILHVYGEQSSIDSKEFFLTGNGANDPLAEWKALENSDPVDIACRFPARVLVHQKITGKTWPAAPCTDYLIWKKRLTFRSVSVVYSTAYAGNPASILGHNILKFNSEDELPLLDYGLGFLANSDPSDNPALYILKGLFGGYPGFFTLQPYYELVNNYAFAENRDLWELEIDLSPDQRELLLAHVWELIHYASASYYFTRVNCSTMLLELLDAVKPEGNLRESFRGLVLPQAVMQSVAKGQTEHHEQFWPSQKRIFDQRWSRLDSLQQKKMLDWKEQNQLVSVADDAAVLDAILDQINMQKSKLNVDQQTQLREQENAILLARSQLPALHQELPTRNSAENNPLRAHGTHKLTWLAGREADQSALGLRLRYGLHDLLDEPKGFNPYYHINFLDLTLWKNPDVTRYQLEAVDLLSLNPYSAVDPAASWAVQVGAEDGQAHARGGYGLSWELAARRSLIYALAAVELRPEDSNAGVRLGWFHSWTSRWRQLVEWHPRFDQSWHWDWQWEQRVSIDREWQLEWRVARGDHWKIAGGLGRFF